MAEEAIKFVQFIENNPCIYNNTMQEYSRKDITEKAWAAIALEMNWSVADCKEKWKNMRNGFVRSLKPCPSGSFSKAKKPYYLHDIMSFVLPYVKHVQHSETTSNFILPDSDVHRYEDMECTENDEFNCDVMPQTSKHSQDTPSSVEKRKKVEEKDEVDVAMLHYLQEKKNQRKTAD
ncbi:PREDICTED: uncharacterized protein LOC108373203 [Rhagoletis zephyria]|uniref:uncharacterized protein LOC108373203 n=1 Tax=Rhagoletis zephyria TaxID=28612 RepID=UPI0008114FE5|nr:PREDICTED: uncharacterized protein LOC108373203 [Rhagoletis zephyria]